MRHQHVPGSDNEHEDQDPSIGMARLEGEVRNLARQLTGVRLMELDLATLRLDVAAIRAAGADSVRRMAGLEAEVARLRSQVGPPS